MFDDWNKAHPTQRFWRRLLPAPRRAGGLHASETGLRDFTLIEGARYDIANYDWKGQGKAVVKARFGRAIVDDSASRRRGLRRRPQRRSNAEATAV